MLAPPPALDSLVAVSLAPSPALDSSVAAAVELVDAFGAADELVDAFGTTVELVDAFGATVDPLDSLVAACAAPGGGGGGGMLPSSLGIMALTGAETVGVVGVAWIPPKKVSMSLTSRRSRST